MRILQLLLLALSILAGEAPQGTVVVTLTGSVQLRPSESLFGEAETSLHDAALRLREAIAASEPLIVLDLSGGFAPGLAAAEELAAVLRERPAGKRVACVVDGLSDAALVVASACNEVVMPKSGLLMIKGLTLESYYLAPALAKMGVQFHAVASGPYKSAPEMFTRSGPSDEARADHRQLLGSLDRVAIALSQRNGFDAAALTRARASGIQTAIMAKQQGIVTAVVEIGEWLAQQPAPIRRSPSGRDAPDLSSMAGTMRFWAQLMTGDNGSARAARAVAVVELAGMILPGKHSNPGETICDADTVEMLDRLADDKRIVAVVLRIDSGGGDAGASDLIHHAVRRLDAVKPVVCLLDGVAASGGYWIACAAREIRCHRSTITGSIGAFALVPDLDNTLGLIGIHRHVEMTSPRGDLLHPGSWGPDKEAALRDIIVDVDGRFRALVGERRRLSVERVDKIAAGRVFTGDQAVAEGLVDGIGTLTSTVARARQMASEPAPLPLERYPKNSGLAARLGLSNSLACITLGVPVQEIIRLSRRGVRVMAWGSVGEVR